MIHLHDARGHRWVTDAQLKDQFPELHAALHEPRPFNEGGEKLKCIRKKTDMTLRELSRETGISLGTLSEIETGRLEPTQEQIDAWAWACQKKREKCEANVAR